MSQLLLLLAIVAFNLWIDPISDEKRPLFNIEVGWCAFLSPPPHITASKNSVKMNVIVKWLNIVKWIFHLFFYRFFSSPSSLFFALFRCFYDNSTEQVLMRWYGFFVNVTSLLPNFHTNSFQFICFFWPDARHRSAAIHLINSKVPFIEWVSFYGNFNSFAICIPKKACKHFKRITATLFSSFFFIFQRENEKEKKFERYSIHLRHSGDHLIKSYYEHDAMSDVVWINYTNAVVRNISIHTTQTMLLQMFR